MLEVFSSQKKLVVFCDSWSFGRLLYETYLLQLLLLS